MEHEYKVESRPENVGTFRMKFPLFAGVFLLISAFSVPLLDLFRYTSKTELYSHVILVPFIAGYLYWTTRDAKSGALTKIAAYSATLLVLGVGSLALFMALKASGTAISLNDYLFLTVFSFVNFLLLAGLRLYSGEISRTCIFPAVFLYFIVPMPEVLTGALESFSQVASAELAYLMLQESGTPVYRDGLFFKLPGLAIEVAKECSGIRSSLILFITGLLAGRLFLRLDVFRLILVLLVIPIGIIRNAFRITVIALLTIHVDPGIIDGPLHRNGGPLFFALSLVILFAVLIMFRKLENRKLKKLQMS